MEDSFDKFGSYLMRSDTTGFTSFLWIVPCDMHLFISDIASKRDNFHSIRERAWNHLNYISCTDKENLHKQKSSCHTTSRHKNFLLQEQRCCFKKKRKQIGYTSCPKSQIKENYQKKRRTGFS